MFFMPIDLPPQPINEKPPWIAAEAFLKFDKTNEQPYTASHSCEAFALDLTEAGKIYALDFYRVRTNFINGRAHIFNAIDTRDRGTVYIEPQDDLPYERPFIGGYMCWIEEYQNQAMEKCYYDPEYQIQEILIYE